MQNSTKVYGYVAVCEWKLPEKCFQILCALQLYGILLYHVVCVKLYTEKKEVLKNE